MLHQREETARHRELQPAAFFASFGAGAGLVLAVLLPPERIVIARLDGILVHTHARTHVYITDIAVRRVRGLPGASQLSFRVINDMRSYRGTHHPVSRRRGVLTSYRIPRVS